MLEHNGRITVETYDRGNTCFTVDFPLAGAAA
jgi:signal transduction histidine kinase